MKLIDCVSLQYWDGTDWLSFSPVLRWNWLTFFLSSIEMEPIDLVALPYWDGTDWPCFSPVLRWNWLTLFLSSIEMELIDLVSLQYWDGRVWACDVHQVRATQVRGDGVGREGLHRHRDQLLSRGGHSWAWPGMWQTGVVQLNFIQTGFHTGIETEN